MPSETPFIGKPLRYVRSDWGPSQDVFACQDVFMPKHPDTGPKHPDSQDFVGGIGYWALSIRYWVLGYWLLGTCTGYWVLGTKKSRRVRIFSAWAQPNILT